MVVPLEGGKQAMAAIARRVFLSWLGGVASATVVGVAAAKPPAKPPSGSGTYTSTYKSTY